MSFNYGISKKDLEFVKVKIDKQIDYLSSNTIQTNSGQLKSFLDMSMSANLSSRYYAEVTNRANTIHSLSFDRGHKAVFLTVTLNGCFRDALRGDYSRFTSDDKKCLPSFIKMKIERDSALTIKDLIAILNYQWDSFSARSVFRGVNKQYIRVFEPHKKDGVPHFHALLYIPSNIIPKVMDKFKEIFNAPMNLSNKNLSFEQQQNGEISGFQWTLNNPTGYVMKYIQKTFKNINEDEEITPLSAWYVKYKVRRFLTSRSTIPMWVYRKIFYLEKDLYSLSSMLNEPDCICEWDFETKYIRVSNPTREIEILYNQGNYSYSYAGRVLKEKKLIHQKYDLRKPILKSQIKTRPFELVEWIGKDGSVEHQYKHFRNGDLVEFFKVPIAPAEMSDLNLRDYYYSLDIENENISLLHFGITQNECIKRGLIVGELQSLNDFNMDF